MIPYLVAAITLCSRMLSGRRPLTSVVVATTLWSGMLLSELRLVSPTAFSMLAFSALFAVPAAYVRSQVRALACFSTEGSVCCEELHGAPSEGTGRFAWCWDGNCAVFPIWHPSCDYCTVGYRTEAARGRPLMCKSVLCQTSAAARSANHAAHLCSSKACINLMCICRYMGRWHGACMLWRI